jgi:hypothetical protein
MSSKKIRLTLKIGKVYLIKYFNKNQYKGGIMKKILCVFTIIFLIKCATPGDINMLSAEATGTSRDYQLAIDKAKMDARLEMTQQLNTYVQALIKKFDEEAGITDDSELLGLYSKTSKVVVDQSLVGSHIKGKPDVKKEDNIYKATVVMEAPLGQARKRLLDQIKASDELYQRFSNSESFKELQEEGKKE